MSEKIWVPKMRGNNFMVPNKEAQRGIQFFSDIIRNLFYQFNTCKCSFQKAAQSA